MPVETNLPIKRRGRPPYIFKTPCKDSGFRLCKESKENTVPTTASGYSLNGHERREGIQTLYEAGKPASRLEPLNVPCLYQQNFQVQLPAPSDTQPMAISHVLALQQQTKVTIAQQDSMDLNRSEVQGIWVGRPPRRDKLAERQILWDLVVSCDYVVGTPADAKTDLSLKALNGPESTKLDATMNEGAVKPTRQPQLKSDNPEYFKQVIDVEDIPAFFDSLPHDYNILSRPRCSSSFRLRYLDPPGLIPTDIRSRHINVQINRDALRDNPNGCVFRVVYKCSGSCLRADDGSGHINMENRGQVDSKGLYEKPGLKVVDKDNAPVEEKGRGQKKAVYPTCNSMLMLEFTGRQAANGQCAVVCRRLEYHLTGPNSALRISPYVRSVLHELVSRTGMPHLRLRYEYEERLRHAPYIKWLEAHYPHRAPRERHYPSVVVTIGRNAKGKTKPRAKLRGEVE
ncbi:hypothetical protein L204_100718 [Cryptococcus depauperatus]